MMQGTRLRTSVSIVSAVLCLALYAGGCRSAGVVRATGTLYANRDIDAGSEYFARSPSYGTPEKDLAECLFRAASQVSLRQKVQVTSTSSGNRLTVALDYQKNNYAILENMSVVRYFRDDEVTEAVVRISKGPSFKTPRVSINDSKDSSGKPSWISDPPAGGSFYAAVGTMANPPESGDGFEYADTNAVGALALLAVKPVVSGNVKTWKAVFSGAYVARRWYDEASGVYYSLAVVPR
jgi:hypothetical protein